MVSWTRSRSSEVAGALRGVFGRKASVSHEEVRRRGCQYLQIDDRFRAGNRTAEWQLRVKSMRCSLAAAAHSQTFSDSGPEWAVHVEAADNLVGEGLM
jgi:hypothetical protein